MRFIVFILFIFICHHTFSQTYNRDNVSPKAMKLYSKSLGFIADGFYKEAVATLNKTIEADQSFVDAYLSLAGVYGEKKDYANAVINYQLAQQKDTIYFAVYNLPYSINLAGLGKFEEALKAVNFFLAIQNVSDKGLKAAQYRKRCYEFAVDYKAKHPNNNYVFEPVNLGDSINTERSEYYPTLSISDSLLVFTRMTNTGEYFVKSAFTNNHFAKAYKKNISNKNFELRQR